MKKLIQGLLLILIPLSCDLDTTSSEIPDIKGNIIFFNGLAETFSVLNVDDEYITNDVAETGQWPNHIIYNTEFEDELIVVNSGDNSISILDIGTLETNLEIYLEENKNPYMAIAQSGTNYIYTTCYYSNEVVKVDRETGETISTITVGDKPQGGAILGTKLFIANTCYGEDTGTITVIDIDTDTVLTTFDTGKNPQSLIAFENEDEIHIICTGENDESDETDGEVIVIDSDSYETIVTISVGGSPVYSEGSINETEDIVYLYGTSGIYAYNYSSYTKIDTDIDDTFYSGLTYVEETNKIYASNFDGDEIDIYNGEDYSFEKSIEASDGPQQLLFIKE